MLKSDLEELYLNQKLSQREIAKKLNCSQTNVRYYLSKYGLRRNKRRIVSDPSDKLCPKCLSTKPISEFYKAHKRARGSWCKTCMTKQVVERQRRYKAEYVRQKGGCCRACGFHKYLGALEFHHIDPSKKESKMAKITRSPDSPEVQAELAKCVLLCSNCHKMVHAGVIECPPL